MRRILPIALASALLTAPAWAQTGIGDPAAGQRLAQRWCSGCHAVGANPERAADAAPPAFASVAAMPSTTPLSLRAFLQTSHPSMPDFQLGREELDNVIAYILSLRRR